MLLLLRVAAPGSAGVCFPHGEHPRPPTHPPTPTHTHPYPQVEVVLSTPRKLVPVHTNGRPPSYFIIAGLVFTPATVPYLRSEYGKEYDFGALCALPRAACFCLCAGSTPRAWGAACRGRLLTCRPLSASTPRPLPASPDAPVRPRLYPRCKPSLFSPRPLSSALPKPSPVNRPRRPSPTAFCRRPPVRPQVKLLDKMLHGQAKTPDQEVVVLSQARWDAGG